MQVADKVVDARLISERHLDIEGYLEGLQKYMIEENEDILNLYTEAPEFKITPPPFPGDWH